MYRLKTAGHARRFSVLYAGDMIPEFVTVEYEAACDQYFVDCSSGSCQQRHAFKKLEDFFKLKAGCRHVISVQQDMLQGANGWKGTHTYGPGRSNMQNWETNCDPLLRRKQPPLIGVRQSGTLPRNDSLVRAKLYGV